MGAASPRRQYGTGGVSVDAEGRYVGRFDHGYTKTGKRRRVTVYHRPTPGESEKTSLAAIKKKMAARRKEVDAGGATVQQRATVKAYADAWLDRRPNEVRPTTWRADRSLTLNHIVPTIGHRRLDQLTPDDVRAVATAARKEVGADSTVVRLHATLRRMLEDATLDGHAIRPAVLLVKPPAAGQSDREAIPLPHALAVLAVAVERPDASRWVGALLQGTRQGESLGLTWPMVDFGRGRIDVSWQLKALPYKHGCADGKPTCGRRFGGDCPDATSSPSPGTRSDSWTAPSTWCGRSLGQVSASFRWCRG